MAEGSGEELISGQVSESIGSDGHWGKRLFCKVLLIFQVAGMVMVTKPVNVTGFRGLSADGSPGFRVSS